MKTNNNVLYFEGAGMDYDVNEHSNVGNYRIRTAFTNNEGVQFYLELSRGTRRAEAKNGKYKVVSEWALHVDYLFNIEEMQKTRNEQGISYAYDRKMNHIENAQVDYTKEAITAWINSNLNCSFDTIEVLSMFHGYHVHGENGTYNLIDNHVVNHELAEKRKQAYNEVDAEYRSLCKSKYSVIGLHEMDNNSITLRCHASKQALGDNPRIKTITLS